MTITVVFQLPRELKISSALPLGLLEEGTKWCRAASSIAASASPQLLSPIPLVQAGWEEGKGLGWSPSGWFLSGRSIPAHPRSFPTRPAATSQWLAFSIAGQTLTPELIAFGLFVTKSGICSALCHS